MKRQEQDLILRLWRDWCRVWPQQYGHESLEVKPDGYDPVFDLVPAQTYKDFYFEVVRGHPKLRHLNAFEVVDVALNQIKAPETQTLREQAELPPTDVALELPVVEESDVEVDEVRLEDTPENIEPFVVEVELKPAFDPMDPQRQADSA